MMLGMAMQVWSGDERLASAVQVMRGWDWTGVDGRCVHRQCRYGVATSGEVGKGLDMQARKGVASHSGERLLKAMQDWKGWDR